MILLGGKPAIKIGHMAGVSSGARMVVLDDASGLGSSGTAYYVVPRIYRAAAQPLLMRQAGITRGI